MLTESGLQSVLDKLPTRTIGVIGDLFLDRYLDIDASLSEPSLETGLDAYQVVCVRSQPGALGTVINNLVALGVGRVNVVSLIGDDGEGYELRQALARMPSVDMSHLLQDATRRTPTYTKPMFEVSDQPARELNRLDIKNRAAVPHPFQEALERAVDEVWEHCNALIVLDQVSEENCGVISAGMRGRLAQRAEADPAKFVLVDSRERIGLFRNVRVKPNQAECIKAIGGPSGMAPTEAARALACRTGRPVYCTWGAEGILLAEPGGVTHIPGYPVTGPIDIVGAGDSSSAAIACAVASGLSEPEAAAFGNLVASITIQQIGTTGTASPAQVRQRWAQVRALPAT
jgi:bifunctional ADP-heptose synthase (sugar kinase/adenylyltransferase)